MPSICCIPHWLSPIPAPELSLPRPICPSISGRSNGGCWSNTASTSSKRSTLCRSLECLRLSFTSHLPRGRTQATERLAVYRQFCTSFHRHRSNPHDTVGANSDCLPRLEGKLVDFYTESMGACCYAGYEMVSGNRKADSRGRQGNNINTLLHPIDSQSGTQPTC